MRITINLATKPFVELRPFFLRLRILMGALAVLAIGLGVFLHIEHKKLAVAQQQMDDLRRHTIAFQDEKKNNEARMRQPANAAVLDRAHFLNQLFLRKSFSWTGVMMDLETVLPTGVQVTSIDPATNIEGDVVIRLRVAGDRDRAVQLVRNLEHSARFLAPRLNSESQQNKEQAANSAAAGAPGGVEFEILANYNPLPETAAKPVPEKTAKASSSQASPAKPKKHAAKPGPNDGVVLKPFRPATPAKQGGVR